MLHYINLQTLYNALYYGLNKYYNRISLIDLMALPSNEEMKWLSLGTQLHSVKPNFEPLIWKFLNIFSKSIISGFSLVSIHFKQNA